MLEKIKNIEVRYKITVIMTFVWGILAHGYAMTNALMYHDGLLVERVGATYVSGRWFLGLLGEKGLIGKLFGTYNLPFLSGILFLILIAIANVLIIDLFDIKGNISCALLSAVLVVFPTITTMFGYIYTMDYYAFAVLLSVLGVWAAKKQKRVWLGMLISVVCIVCSLGIYQAYIGFALTLFVLLFADCILSGEIKGFWAYILTAVRYVGILGISYVAYMLLNKLFLKIMHVEMVDYQNLNSMGKITLGGLKQGVKQAYHDFVYPNPEIFPERAGYVYYATLVVIAVLCVCIVIRLLSTRRFLDTLLFGLAMMVLPIGLNSIYIAGAIWIYSLMMYSACLVFFVPFILLNHVEIKYVKKACLFAGCLLIAYLSLFYTTYANRCYMDATYTQQKTISWMNQLIAQIKATDGFRDDMRIMYIGGPVVDMSFSADTEYQVAITHYGNFDVRNSYNWYKFMRKWCGFEMPEATVEEQTAILNREDVQNMPSYPDSGSIRIIDDVVVVRY